jgi:hypothetical protein
VLVGSAVPFMSGRVGAELPVAAGE